MRTEQKNTERKTRDDANAAEKERRRTEAGGTETGRSRFLPTFLGKSGATAGAGAGATTAAVVEETADTAEGGAHAATLPDSGSGAAATDYPEPAGETVHEKVTLGTGEPVHAQLTMDPSEAAYAVAAADAEDALKPEQTPLPDADSDDDVRPKDTTRAPAYSSDPVPEETVATTTLATQTSPTSPSKRDSRVKSFFKKFRTGSKAENDFKPDQPITSEAQPRANETVAPHSSAANQEDDPAATDSIRDVAFAGRSDNETEDMYGGSAKPDGRVSPLEDDAEPGVTSGGPAVTGDADRRDVSPPSNRSSSLSEDPYVIAADVASSRYSTEKGDGEKGEGSKRNSGYDQVAHLTDEDEEPRGRKGFRERFLKKVMPGKDKDKKQPGTFTSSAVGASAAAQTDAAAAPTTNQAVTDTTAASTSQAEPETTNSATDEPEPARTKVQEPSTTSTEATGNTTVTGATTPALTHAQTNDPDDEDFEEARDTFDEGRLVSASKVDSGSARIVDVNTPMSPPGPKPRASGEGSRFTEEL